MMATTRERERERERESERALLDEHKSAPGDLEACVIKLTFEAEQCMHVNSDSGAGAPFCG